MYIVRGDWDKVTDSYAQSLVDLDGDSPRSSLHIISLWAGRLSGLSALDVLIALRISLFWDSSWGFWDMSLLLCLETVLVLRYS